MRTDITVIGDVNVDLLTKPIPRLPKKDSQLLIPSPDLTIGGGAANFAFTASKLRLRTMLVGLVGEDVFGDYIVKKVREFGIENKIRRTKREKTGITIGIQLKDGSSSLLTYRGTNSILSLRDFKLSDVKGKVVHIGGYNLLDGLRKDVYKTLKHAKKKGMLTSLDPDIKSRVRFDVKKFRKTAKIVDFFFPNKAEGKLLTRKSREKEIVRDLLKLGCKTVALKCGEKGCMVGKVNKISKIKGFRVKAVSPTGTGDIFNASFIFNYLKTKDIRKAGKFANAACALAITKTGEGRYPSWRQVIKFLRNRYGKHKKYL